MTIEAQSADDPIHRMRDVARIDAALRQAVREALLDHKRTGDPIVVWRDGKVVWIPPEEILVDEEPDGTADGHRAATKTHR